MGIIQIFINSKKIKKNFGYGFDLIKLSTMKL